MKTMLRFYIVYAQKSCIFICTYIHTLKNQIHKTRLETYQILKEIWGHRWVFVLFHVSFSSQTNISLNFFAMKVTFSVDGELFLFILSLFFFKQKGTQELVTTNKNKISKWNVMTLKVDGGCGQRLKQADTCLINGSYVAVVCLWPLEWSAGFRSRCCDSST